jgi:Fic-DOC domain mobile mystery protein B
MTHEWQPIPGETPIDPSFLEDRSILTRSQLCVAEAENIRRAVVKYLAARPSKRKAPFTYAWMLRLHREMFCDVWQWAGVVRTIDLQIGVPWPLIGQALGGLALDIAAWAEDESLLLEQSVAIHHRAVQIHPFQNGNGRWARLLANIWLARHGQAVVTWPEPDLGQSHHALRDQYIAAIRLADAGDRRPLMELHRRHWKFSEARGNRKT